MKPKYGYCAVTADFLHCGHVWFIKQCKTKCQELIVGVMTDEYIRKFKKREPIQNQTQRAEVIINLKQVSRVMFQDEYEFGHHLMRMKEHWGKDFIIIDSAEHKRKNVDKLIPYKRKKFRGREITCTEFRRENSNHCKCKV